MSSSPTRGTAGYIIFESMFEAGKLAKGDEPKSEDYATWLNRLNSMTAQWMTQGIKLFTWEDVELTIVTGKAQYLIGPGAADVNVPLPYKVTQSYYIDLFGNQRPLTQLTWDDWTRLSNKTQVSAPNSYFVDRRPTVMNFWVWLTPDVFTVANGTVHVVLTQQTAQPIQITDKTGFPPEWELGLIWGLADEKCGGSPTDVQVRCQQRATYYKDQLENFDVEEGGVQFQPDARNLYSSRFT